MSLWKAKVLGLMKIALLNTLLATLAATAAWGAAPFADVAVDNTKFAECAGSGVATFELDGRASYDPDGGPLTYEWTGPFGTVDGATPSVAIPLGAHTITLTVTDQESQTASASFTAVVVDTRPPTVEVTLFPSEVAATGGLVEVNAFVDVQDLCGSGVSFVLDSVSDSAFGDGSVVEATLGSPDTSFRVLAAVDENAGGPRTYVVIYEGMDAAGHRATGSAQLLVRPLTDNSFLANPDRMRFEYAVGGSVPEPRTATVTAVGYSSFQVSSSASWLHASPAAGDAPQELAVWVEPQGLTPGQHSATLRVSSGGGRVEPIAVQLRVLGQPELFTLPEALSFDFDRHVGDLARLTTQVFVGARHSPASLALSTDATWLHAEASTAATPGWVTVWADPARLEEGVFSGRVLVGADNPLAEPIALPVSLEVTSSARFLAPQHLLHSATMKHQPLAPGSLATAFYFNPLGVVATAEGLPLPTELGGLSGSLDGLPLHFLYVSPTQFNAQLPSGLPPGVSRLRLYFNGELQGETAVQILPAAPGIFTEQDSALCLHPDGSINGPENPAPRGSVVALLLTGQGATDPPVPDGAGAPATPPARPVWPAGVLVNGAPIEPAFVGLEPGKAGLLRLELSTAGLPPGPSAVRVEMGGARSNAATIYVGQ